MTAAEYAIRLTVAQYCAVYPNAKPCVTLTIHPDQRITLFMGTVDNAQSSAVQGEGATLEETAAAFRAHLARRLAAVRVKDAEDLAKMVESRTKFHAGIDAAVAILAGEP